MFEFGQIIKRNMRIYLRDKTAVFFSLMAMLIVIMLMVVFLGDMNINAVTGILEGFGARDADKDRKNAELLVLWWTISGIVSINAVTITMASITTMINDMATNRMQSFYTTPISRIKIAVGYMGSTCIASIIICTGTLIIAEIYAIIQGADVLSLSAHLKILLMIVINSFAYSSMMYLIALLVKSEKAWGSFNGIIGTLVGFLGAIYIPMAALPDGVQSVLKCLPVLHGTSMFRSVITEDIVNTTFKGIPADVIADYREQMGITVKAGDYIFSEYLQLAILFGCGIIFLILSVLVMKRKGKEVVLSK